MSDDIVGQIENAIGYCIQTLKNVDVADVLYDARYQIERLRAENERLLTVAKGDAQMLAAYHKWCEMNGCAPSSSDLSAARAALAEEKK